MSRIRNKSALRHGLYVKRGPEAEVLVGELPVRNLEGEIAYLRVVLGRLAVNLEHNGLGPDCEKPLSDATRKTLNRFNETLLTLLSYVRAHALLSGEPNEYQREIEEGKFLARQKLGVFRYLEAVRGK